MVLSLTVAVFMLAGRAAKADPLLLNFDSPYQSGVIGQTLTYDVTITNNTSYTVYLNADSPSLDTLILNDEFDANAPLSLGSRESSGDLELFTVFIPFGTPSGLYTGTFEILGSSDPADYTSVAGSTTFYVNVLSSDNVVPEPSSYLLFGSGLAWLAGAFRRRRLI